MINTITSLDTEDGRTVSAHFEKAAILWEEYKGPMGLTMQPEMQYNLQELVQEHDLLQIAAPFTKEDIDA